MAEKRYAVQTVPIYRPFAQNLLVYDGPSMLTGDRILVVASAQNGNRKIGEMLQLWIMPAVSPIDAVKSGADSAVCGDCPHRGDGQGRQRSCYVEWWRSVSNIWQGHTRAERVTPAVFAERARGLQLRIGAYGDPVAVPEQVWEPMLATAGGWTAYTHQWRWAPASFRRWCMASVETPEEMRLAQARGWRTFRVSGGSDLHTFQGLEVVCPHETRGVTCDRCELCRGASHPAKSIVITVHGNGVKWFFQRQAVSA